MHRYTRRYRYILTMSSYCFLLQSITSWFLTLFVNTFSNSGIFGFHYHWLVWSARLFAQGKQSPSAPQHSAPSAFAGTLLMGRQASQCHLLGQYHTSLGIWGHPTCKAPCTIPLFISWPCGDPAAICSCWKEKFRHICKSIIRSGLS